MVSSSEPSERWKSSQVAVAAAPLSGLSVWDSQTCLATALVEELAAFTDEALREAVIVLPTQRLSLWVAASLATRKTAFVPPQQFNLDAFIRTTYAGLTTAAPLPELTDLEAELILAGLIKKHGFRHLRLGHEHEVRQFFAELSDWGLTDSAFANLLNVASENIYLSDQSVDTLRERILELSVLHTVFLEEMHKLGSFTKAQILAQESTALPALLRAQDGSGPPLYIVGFTSLKAQYVPFMQELLQREATRIWVSEPPELTGSLSPLRRIVNDLTHAAQSRIHYRTSTPIQLQDQILTGSSGMDPKIADQPESHQHLAIYQTPTILAEAAFALKLAQDAVRQGLPPSSIAILVSDDTSYGNPLRALTPRLGIGSNMAISTPLAGTTLGTWLAAVFELARSEQTVPELVAYLTHPLTLVGTSLSRATLYQEIAETGAAQGLSTLLASSSLSLQSKAFMASAMRPFEPFFADVKRRKKSFKSWLSHLEPLLTHALAAEDKRQRDLGRAPENSRERDAVLRSAYEGLRTAMDSLCGLAEVLPGGFTKNDFLSLVGPKILSQDCRDVGEPLRGIQVLSIEEARYIPFERVIVLGALEGQFPRALPKDHLVDNYLKMRIGLPGWQFLEAIEDTTYHLLRSRLPHLSLLYPMLQGTTPTVRSRFIEAALVQREACLEVVASDDFLRGLLRPAEILAAEEISTTEPGVLGCYKGEKASLLLATSASALTALIRCPYRFLLEKLKVKPLEFKDADDPQQEGDWLHSVLEAFFTGKVRKKQVSEPLKAEGWAESGDGFRRYALERLRHLTDMLAPEGFKEAPVKLHLELFAWPQFVDHILRIYGTSGLERTSSGEREAPIGAGSEPLLSVGAHRIHLKGSIDAVERLSGLHLITDYKRRGIPPRQQALDGLSPQLTFYALAYALKREECSLEKAVIGYWSILQGTWTAVASGETAKPHARELGLISSRDNTSLEETAAKLMELWRWRLDAIMADGGLFEPDPSVCDHCSYAGVCRKDDPVLGDAIAQKAILAPKLGLRGGGARKENADNEPRDANQGTP